VKRVALATAYIDDFNARGGLLTLDILAPLERRLGVPVVSSSPAGFWDVVQRAGIDPRVPGYGRLFTVSEL
jgi:maleate cis-trans isomerase